MSILNDEEYERLSREYEKVRYKCKCGHSVIIPAWVDKQLCNWCGNYVYKDKKDEFKNKLKEMSKRL